MTVYKARNALASTHLSIAFLAPHCPQPSVLAILSFFKPSALTRFCLAKGPLIQEVHLILSDFSSNSFSPGKLS